MRSKFFFIICLLVIVLSVRREVFALDEGLECVICTIGVGVLLGQGNAVGQEQFRQEMLHHLRPVEEALLSPADYLCHSVLGFCKNFPGCTLWDSKELPSTQGRQLPEVNKRAWLKRLLQVPLVLQHAYYVAPDQSRDILSLLLGDEPDNPWVRVADHYPFEDADRDNFSTYRFLRGYDWRGEDCNDTNSDIYPGRTETSSGLNPAVDYNCNGMTVEEEQKVCGGENMGRGVAVLGDSASALFHVPVAPRDPATGAALLQTALDELDWPQCSWSTGHLSTADCPNAFGHQMNSIYLNLLQRNPCSHNDYQNCAVNGARSSSMTRTIQQTLNRNPSDKPLIVFYSLVGNDVCSSRIGHTSPEDFKNFANITLNYLSGILPANSSIVFIGLEEGTLLWPCMNTRPYTPLGSAVTYGQLWNFLGCTKTSPCLGWLNPNSTLRETTQFWADTLSQQLDELVQSESPRHPNLHLLYHHNTFGDNLRQHVSQGGSCEDMLQLIGGGHPSSLAHIMNANVLWDYLLHQTNAVDILGPINK